MQTLKMQVFNCLTEIQPENVIDNDDGGTQ